MPCMMSSPSLLVTPAPESQTEHHLFSVFLCGLHCGSGGGTTFTVQHHCEWMGRGRGGMRGGKRGGEEGGGRGRGRGGKEWREGGGTRGGMRGGGEGRKAGRRVEGEEGGMVVRREDHLHFTLTLLWVDVGGEMEKVKCERVKIKRVGQRELV